MSQAGFHGRATTGSDYVILNCPLEQLAHWNNPLGSHLRCKKSVAPIAVYFDKINDLAIDHLLAGVFEIHRHIFAND